MSDYKERFREKFPKVYATVNHTTGGVVDVTRGILAFVGEEIEKAKDETIYEMDDTAASIWFEKGREKERNELIKKIEGKLTNETEFGYPMSRLDLVQYGINKACADLLTYLREGEEKDGCANCPHDATATGTRADLITLSRPESPKDMSNSDDIVDAMRIAAKEANAEQRAVMGFPKETTCPHNEGCKRGYCARETKCCMKCRVPYHEARCFISGCECHKGKEEVLGFQIRKDSTLPHDVLILETSKQHLTFKVVREKD